MKKLLVFILFFILCITVVNAETITIDEIASEYSNASIIKYLNEADSTLEIHAYNNIEKNKLQILTGNSVAFSMKYTDEYILYDNTNGKINKYNIDSEYAKSIWIEEVIETVLNIVSNNTVSLSDTYNGTYEEYGLDLVIGNYSIEEENSIINGTYIKYFKISLDKDKINKLIELLKPKEIVVNENILDKFTPSINIFNITSKSVDITASIPSFSGNEATCSIYRSSGIEYTKIGEVKADGKTIFQDTNIEEGKTYHYKVLINTTSNYSSVTEVMIPHKGVTPDDGTNPQTGTFINVLGILLLSIIGIFILTYSKNKFKFKKI